MCTFAAFAFEVMDKEWPLWLVLVGFVGLGVIGFLAGRKWPLAALMLFPLLVYGGLRQALELNDPYVGGAIRAEAGVVYVVLSYAAIGSSFVLLVIGAIQGWKRRKLASTPD